MSQYMDVYYNVATVYHMHVHIHTCVQLSTEHTYIFTYMCTVLYIACEGVEGVRHVCCMLEDFLDYVLWSVQINFQFCIICTDEAHN